MCTAPQQYNALVDAMRVGDPSMLFRTFFEKNMLINLSLANFHSTLRTYILQLGPKCVVTTDGAAAHTMPPV